MTYEDYVNYSNSLSHAVYGPQPRNRLTRKKPKYIAKEGNRYFYSQAEYDAFKRGGRRKASTNIYNQRVRKRIKDSTTYGPIQRTSQSTSSKKSVRTRVRQALQTSRPKMVRMRNSFMTSIKELKRKAADIISRGREIANSIFSYGRTKLAEFSGVAAWKISEFKAKASTAISRGKKFIKNLIEYREKKRLGDEFRRSRTVLDPRLNRNTNTERRSAEIPEWMRRK